MTEIALGTVICPTDQADERIGPVLLHADRSGADLIRLERGGRIWMNGPDTFRAAVRCLAIPH